jgi:hypothetical protein
MVMRIKEGEKGQIKLVINCHVSSSQNNFVYRTYFPPLEPFKTPKKPYTKPIGKPIRKPFRKPITEPIGEPFGKPTSKPFAKLIREPIWLTVLGNELTALTKNKLKKSCTVGKKAVSLGTKDKHMTRTQDLNTVIGKDCSCNQSPTLRAKLISVGKFKSILEVTATMYNRAQWSNAYVGQKITLDNSIIHNMYFS